MVSTPRLVCVFFTVYTVTSSTGRKMLPLASIQIDNKDMFHHDALREDSSGKPRSTIPSITEIPQKHTSVTLLEKIEKSLPRDDSCQNNAVFRLTERIKKLENRFEKSQYVLLKKMKELEMLNFEILDNLKQPADKPEKGSVTDSPNSHPQTAILDRLLQKMAKRENHNRNVLQDLLDGIGDLKKQNIQQKQVHEDIKREIADLRNQKTWNVERNGSNICCVDLIHLANVTEKETTISAALPKDCYDVKTGISSKPGVYKIRPNDFLKPLEVFCEHGWTFILRRFDGSVDFNRTWKEFAEGFGNREGEYWIGNDHLHFLTNEMKYSLRIEVESTEGVSYWATYSKYWIDSERKQYKLHVGGFSGNYKDYMDGKNALSFTTRDRDNDHWITGNCAQKWNGAGWLKRCGPSFFRKWLPEERETDLSCMNFKDKCVKRSIMKIIPLSA